MKYSLKSATAQHWEHDLVGCISKSFTWSNLCPTCHMSLSWGIVYCLSAATTHLKFIYVLMRPSRGDLPPDGEALGIHCSCSRQWSRSRSFSRSLQREQQQQQLSMGGREKKNVQPEGAGSTQQHDYKHWVHALQNAVTSKGTAASICWSPASVTHLKHNKQ